MRYAKKYIENFRFVNRVVWLTVKYHLSIYLCSSQKIGQKITKHASACNISNPNSVLINYQRINKRIDKIVDVLPLRGTCLIRTLVKAEYLRKYEDLFFPIKLGVAINNDGLSAHSWIEDGGGNTLHDTFIKVN